MPASTKCALLKWRYYKAQTPSMAHSLRPGYVVVDILRHLLLFPLAKLFLTLSPQGRVV